MLRRHIVPLAAATFLCAAPILPATAQDFGSWDGVWSGSWGGAAPTSVTIVGGRVARYDYKGEPVPVTVSKVERLIVTFGTPGRYAIRMARTGRGSASATYKSFVNNDVAAADLTRN